MVRDNNARSSINWHLCGLGLHSLEFEYTIEREGIYLRHGYVSSNLRCIVHFGEITLQNAQFGQIVFRVPLNE